MTAALDAETMADPSASGLAEARRHLAGDVSTDPGSLRAELRSWRAALARAAAVSPTVVLSDRALEAVAHRRPHDDADLAAVADLGPLARARHGPSLLAIVAGHQGPDRHPLVADTADPA